LGERLLEVHDLALQRDRLQRAVGGQQDRGGGRLVDPARLQAADPVFAHLPPRPGPLSLLPPPTRPPVGGGPPILLSSSMSWTGDSSSPSTPTGMPSRNSISMTAGLKGESSGGAGRMSRF